MAGNEIPDKGGWETGALRTYYLKNVHISVTWHLILGTEIGSTEYPTR